MNARTRRLLSDYEKIVKDFSGHPYIGVKSLQGDPPEVYQVSYKIPGIHMEGQRIMPQTDHLVQISLPVNYPRQKPVCTVETPIWHPNFRDGQICIGDIWGAGETVSDIIVHIGDMIQYRIWNTNSPLSADAAHWASANKDQFPIGRLELWKPDPKGNQTGSSPDTQRIAQEAEILISFDDEHPSQPKSYDEQRHQQVASYYPVNAPEAISNQTNDIDISTEELRYVSWTPTPSISQYQQTIHSAPAIRPSAAFVSSSYLSGQETKRSINLSSIFSKGALAGAFGGFAGWLAVEYLVTMSLNYLFPSILSAVISFCLSFMEERYVGARGRAFSTGIKKLFIGLGTGFVGGVIAGSIFNALINEIAKTATSSSWLLPVTFARAFVWAALGLSIGITQGLAPKNPSRLKNGLVGGLIGGFLGGLPFDYLTTLTDDNAVLSRAVGFTIIGLVIGIAIGTVEQINKQAWFKVVRGDFEGKEFILHLPVVRIGSTIQSNIVLFKDKLVAPIHAEIRNENGQHLLVDLGTTNGTYINGTRMNSKVLREGDSIALGNTLMIYHVRNVPKTI